MDYKEKYEQAIERLKQWDREHPCAGYVLSDRDKFIFPELAESEDEKVRKEIINYFQCQSEVEPTRKEIHNKWIAWLEKQGEHYKFRNGIQVGDKVTRNDAGWLVNLSQLKRVAKPAEQELSEDEKIRKMLIEFFGKSAEFNGSTNGISDKDILAWIERQGITKLSEEEQNRFAKGVLTSCAMSFIDYLDAHKYEGKMCVSNGECKDIENAFHNAMWDRLHRYYCKYIEKQGEQKPEENKGNIGGISANSEWGEEDKDLLYDTLSNLTELKDRYGEEYGKVGDCINWLKSLKPQPKQSFDEGTQQWIDTIIKDYEDLYNTDKDHRATIQAKISILKSLRPQNKWKPSDEQIRALKHAFTDGSITFAEMEILATLYEGLKFII